MQPLSHQIAMWVYFTPINLQLIFTLLKQSTVKSKKKKKTLTTVIITTFKPKPFFPPLEQHGNFASPFLIIISHLQRCLLYTLGKISNEACFDNMVCIHIYIYIQFHIQEVLAVHSH